MLIFLSQSDVDEPTYAQVSDKIKAMSLKNDPSEISKNVLGPRPPVPVMYEGRMRPARSAEDICPTLEYKKQQNGMTIFCREYSLCSPTVQYCCTVLLCSQVLL